MLGTLSASTSWSGTDDTTGFGFSSIGFVGVGLGDGFGVSTSSITAGLSFHAFAVS